MSKAPIAPQTVVEWSPTHVSWVGANHDLITFPSLRDAAESLPARSVVVAVSRRTAFVRAYRVPNAGKAEVQRILSMQIGQLFPIPANELSFDFHLTHDVNAEGKLAIVVAMRSADLHSLHEQARAAGIKITRVVATALGAPFVAQSLGFADGAVVHRTAEGLAIDLVTSGELRYSRVAPMPANAIGIDAEVSRTFAAAVLPPSPTIAAGALALPDAAASTDTWALEALSGAHLDVDLKTPDQIELSVRRDELQRVRLGLVLLGAAMILSVYQFLRWSDSQKVADQYNGRWTRMASSLRKLHDAEVTKANAANTLRTTLERAFKPAQSVSDILTTASNSTPQGVWLTGFSLERGKPLSLRGTATKEQGVADFQDTLVRETRFRDVKLVSATNGEIEGTPIVQFSISAFPVGNLPLIEAKKKGSKR